MGKFKSKLAYTGRGATVEKQGSSRFATQAEANAGVADDLIISPLILDAAVDALIADASETVKGIVELSTAAEITTGTSLTLVPSVKRFKDYVDGVAIAGAPISDESTNGIGQISTDGEAVAGTANNPGVTALFVTPSNLSGVFAAPPAAGIGTTTPREVAATVLSASGAFSLAGDQVQISEGGTGAANAGAARTALGLAIGTDVQAWDTQLDDIAALTVTDSNFIVGDGTNWVVETGATVRTSLGLAIGTNVQAWDQGLEDVSGLAVTDSNFIVGDGTNWVAETGATVRTSLGLVIGTNVQAWDTQLDDIAALAVTNSNFIVGDGTNWVAETGATARTSLGLGSIATQASNSVSITGGSVTAITDITVADGGTGVSSFTDGGVLVGSDATAITALAVGSDGQILVGSTGTDPVFATVGSANTSIAATLGAGTLSLDVDESYLQTVTVTIATAQVLLLATTPIEVVAAPGSDKIIEFLGAKIILNYNSVVYTESGDNLGIKYTNAAGVQVSQNIETTGFIDQAADFVTNALPSLDVIVSAAGSVNKALVLDNLGSNFGAGNSPIDVQVRYRVVTAGL